MQITDLPSDMQQAIVDHVISDPHGNKTIPGLIVGRGLRGASKELRRLLTATATPYDGDAVYKKSWPHTFRGGLAFGDCEKDEQRFYVVRDRRTGKVFACTIHAGHRLDEVHRVDRTWPLWRLAQLLNGHDADWEHRLADMESISEGEVVFVPKRELGPLAMIHGFSVKERNQLETISRPMQEAPTIINKTDFVAHHVVKLPDSPSCIKMPALVLHTAKDYGHHAFLLHATWLGGCPTFRGPKEDSYIHHLSIALGWYDEGATVQATGWMTSLYCHGRPWAAPTAYKGPMPLDRLQAMAALALRRESKRRMAELHRRSKESHGRHERKHRHDGPAARLAKQPRQSAMRAKTRMATQLEYDAASNSDGRFHAHLKSKETRALEAQGIIDDQYATAGTRASRVEYDSDGEYNSDGEVTHLSPSEWRARNCAEATAKAQQDYDNMLVPSDDEEAL